MKIFISNTKRLAIYAFLLFILPVTSALANDTDPFVDDTQDITNAPIDDILAAAVLVAVLIAFRFYAKQKKQQTI